MRVHQMLVRNLSIVATALTAANAHAGEVVGGTVTVVKHTGASGLWILANICYAGMRAQNHKSFRWRVVSFIFGLPGTLLSFFVIEEGSGRAYGIEIPKRSD
jgi:Na+/H+ antiporter NhaD/arsenite permease-like protein